MRKSTRSRLHLSITTVFTLVTGATREGATQFADGATQFADGATQFAGRGADGATCFAGR